MVWKSLSRWDEWSWMLFRLANLKRREGVRVPSRCTWSSSLGRLRRNGEGLEDCDFQDWRVGWEIGGSI